MYKINRSNGYEVFGTRFSEGARHKEALQLYCHVRNLDVRHHSSSQPHVLSMAIDKASPNQQAPMPKLRLYSVLVSTETFFRRARAFLQDTSMAPSNKGKRKQVSDDSDSNSGPITIRWVGDNEFRTNILVTYLVNNPQVCAYIWPQDKQQAKKDGQPVNKVLGQKKSVYYNKIAMAVFEKDRDVRVRSLLKKDPEKLREAVKNRLNA